MTGQALPLWRQLQAAASVLQSVREGVSATAALARVDGTLRPAAQALAFQTLRNLGRAEALRRLMANRPPPPQADALLCTALALSWRNDEAPYEIFTLVDQAVEAAKRDPATKAQANFVNACLRRFLRERDALVSATDRNLVALWNHPSWWIDRLKKDHPQHWQQILQANNTHPPMTLRVNVRKTTQADYLALLTQRGVEAQPVGDYGVILSRAMHVPALPGFADGAISVQDAAAQLAAPLLLSGVPVQDRPLRILDACAAPGGKTAHLLELADAEVTALDIDPQRCERIHETMERLGLKAKVVTADAAQPDSWWDGQAFDAILLDAPCTASGIVRRHPDVRWLRRETDIAQLGLQQSRLLKALWPMLAVHGRLLYCTCSVFRPEGEGQVQTFLAHNKAALLRPAPGHLLPQTGAKTSALPDNLEGDHDGFYYALLEKIDLAAADRSGA
ncbi:16S rRNA (cytosine(967)-C(5))-methyltransferase RsmB [Caenimonas koreensis]|uniref:16S rRNA (cytosine(967)-C(5))-methyltransferase n=1 Tax=Caenimonas koreensis DSM 17982 TaxID=1121255 RepID=A0A844BDZ7_9BURK|nr:16S rRNA (cytosine(967)-C(5))-methyltransferase RsmB [Caenimonas koreensis]MRD49667.1 16S rRNA (cytosine(967)-C(5))-methyltransferase RsmB [Caenimonas koreensis DSM 17982]